MEPFFPFVLLGLAVGLLIWGVSNLSVQERYTKLYATIATAVGVAVLGWFFMTYGKGGPQYAVYSGLLLVGLLVWGLINPVVGRRLARIFAVIAMGLGAGFLTGGIVALVFSFLGKTRKAGQQDAQASEPSSESPHHPA